MGRKKKRQRAREDAVVLFPILSQDVEVVKSLVPYFLSQSPLPGRSSVAPGLMKTQQ